MKIRIDRKIDQWIDGYINYQNVDNMRNVQCTQINLQMDRLIDEG